MHNTTPTHPPTRPPTKSQPCPNGMRQMYMRAFSSAGIPFKRLNYMECHATGTAVGDVIEVDAVGAVFGESHDLETNPIRIASVKSNIGHAEVAAGIFSVIKIVQMMKHRVFLPTAGVTTPRTDYDWAGNNMRVQQEVEPFPEGGDPVIAGISSFGIGGSYGHVVLEEYRPPAQLVAKSAAATASPHAVVAAADATAEPTSYLLPLSAVSLPHLKLFAERMAAYLEERKDAVSLKDLCGTMWANRTRFKFRKAFIASSVEAMQQALAAFGKTGNVQPSGEGRKMQVAYVFTGQGSQVKNNIPPTLFSLSLSPPPPNTHTHHTHTHTHTHTPSIHPPAHSTYFPTPTQSHIGTRTRNHTCRPT